MTAGSAPEARGGGTARALAYSANAKAAPQPAVIEFTVPALPLTLNVWTRKHWAVREREAQRWRDLVAVFGPRYPRVIDPARVSLTFYGRTDAGNCEKLVTDALRGRLITDDSYPHLDSLELRQRPGAARTVIRVEAVESALPSAVLQGGAHTSPAVRRGRRSNGRQG